MSEEKEPSLKELVKKNAETLKKIADSLEDHEKRVSKLEEELF